jgi:endonuclease YncB( thermonuclease family)
VPLGQPRRIFVRQSRRVFWRAVGLLCVAVGAAVFAQPVASSLANILPEAGNPRLVAGDDVAVMDGQTLRVAGHVVRLTGLTAPTTVAGTAALQLAALVRDQRVACQLDGAKAGGNPTARCEAGGTDLNRALVAEGWAEARADAPGLKQAEMVARERHLGVWAGR